MATQTPELTSSPVPGATPPPELDPVAQTLAFLKPWIEFVPRQQRRLGLFIAFALSVHLLVFLFVRIDTTRAEFRHQSRTHVTVENPQTTSVTGQQSGDAFWDRLTDPRLFILPQKPLASLTSDEASLDFTAINSNIGTREMPTAVQPQDFQFVRPVLPPLEQRVGDALRPPRQTFAYQENPPSIATKTVWAWDDALAARQPAGAVDLPSPISDTDLNPTEMRVAVDPSGTVEHVMVEQSCGNGRLDLDQMAVTAARKIHFHSTDQSGLVWGQITIFWHYSPKPREEVVPTPPTGQ